MKYRHIKNLIVFIFLLCISVVLTQCKASNIDGMGNEKVVEASTEIGRYITKKDAKGLMKYVYNGGVYFIDGHFTMQEIEALLKDHDSWLYKHLFSGEASVFEKLQHAPLGIIAVHARSDKAVLVEYKAKNGMPTVENCLVEIDGHWYFDGIFDCN